MSTFSTKLFHRSSILALALVLSLLGNAVIAPAQSAVPLDKHSRKVQKELAKYPQNSNLHIVLKNSPDAFGALGPMTQTGFTFTSAENNATANYRYSEVDKVKTDRQRIGRGAEPIQFRHLMPVVIAGAAVAAGALTYNAMR